MSLLTSVALATAADAARVASVFVNIVPGGSAKGPRARTCSKVGYICDTEEVRCMQSHDGDAGSEVTRLLSEPWPLI